MENCVNQKVKLETKEILEKYPKERSQLIGILNDIQERLEHETGYKCIVLDDYIRLDKAIKADYSKEKDYITETYYDGRGNIISEKTIQYK